MHRLALRALLAVALLASSSALAAPAASFTPRPIQGSTCVAPCTVHFDAIGDGTTETTDPVYSREFHTLIYDWNFGDPGAGSWGIGSRFTAGVTDSKNRDRGPIVSHTYLTANVYTVTLTVANPAGETSETTRTVTVVAPASHFSAANTFCFRSTAAVNYCGCPLDTTPSSGGSCPGGVGDGVCDGASSGNCQTQTSAASAMTAAGAGSGMRWIHFARGTGQTYSGTVASESMFDSTSSPGLIQAFGSGAAPEFTGSSFETGEGWTTVDLNVNRICSGSWCAGDPYGYATFLRMIVSPSGVGNTCYDFGNLGNTEITAHERIAIVENVCAHRGENWMGGKFFVFQGNSMDGQLAPPLNPYLWRAYSVQQLTFNRNHWFNNPHQIDGGGLGVSLFRFGVADSEATLTVDQEANEFNYMTLNTFDHNQANQFNFVNICPDSGCNCTTDTTNDCTSSGCAGQAGSGETGRVRFWRFESNLHRYVDNGTAPSGALSAIYAVWGSNHAVVNEVVKVDDGIASGDTITLVNFGGETLSGVTSLSSCPGPDVEEEGFSEAIGNTLYIATTYSSSITFCGEDGNGTGCDSGHCICASNHATVIGSAGATLATSAGFSAAAATQRLSTTDLYDGTMPAQGSGSAANFVPSVGAAIVDGGRPMVAGVDLAFWIHEDALGNCRPGGSGYDQGAVERDAGACDFNAEPPEPPTFRLRNPMLLGECIPPRRYALPALGVA